MPGMTSTVFDLVGKYAIEKGLPWAFRCTRYAGPGKTPVDLSGLTARLDIHDAFAAGAPILSVGSGSGEIALGGLAGTVAIDLSATQTGGIAATHLRYRLFLIDPQSVARVFLRGRLGLVEGEV